MDKRKGILFLMLLFPLGLLAQVPADMTYEKAISLPAMQWTCPDIEKNMSILASLKDEDDRTYANKVKWVVQGKRNLQII